MKATESSLWVICGPHGPVIYPSAHLTLCICQSCLPLVCPLIYLHPSITSSLVLSKGIHKALPQGVKAENRRRLCVCAAMSSGRKSWLELFTVYCLIFVFVAQRRFGKFLSPFHSSTYSMIESLICTVCVCILP